MTRGRRFAWSASLPSAIALVAAVAALGWIAGRTLPLSWSIARDRREGPPSEAPQRHEASLDDQLAAVNRGDSATIRIESRPLGRLDIERLRTTRNLQVLLLDHIDNAIGDKECLVLAELRGLVHLRIRGGSIGDNGIAHIATLPELTILNVPQSRLTDHGLATLAAAPKLSQLRLGSTHITDAGIHELRRFPALRQLHVINAPVTDKALDELRDLHNLESLYLDGSHVTDGGLERLFRSRPKLHVHVNQQHHDRDPQRGHN